MDAECRNCCQPWDAAEKLEEAALELALLRDRNAELLAVIESIHDILDAQLDSLKPMPPKRKT